MFSSVKHFRANSIKFLTGFEISGPECPGGAAGPVLPQIQDVSAAKKPRPGQDNKVPYGEEHYHMSWSAAI